MAERLQMKLLVRAMFALLLLFAERAETCTSFRVVTRDGAVLVGRSMEFGVELNSAVMIVPRGFRFTSPAPGGGQGLTWQAKYGFVGLNAKGSDMATDGVNEGGVCVHLLLLRGF